MLLSVSVVYVLLYHGFFTCLPIEEHLGCFQILAVMKKTCINIHMWTCIFISLGCISGIGLLDPTVNICSTVFQRMYAILHSYQEYMSSSFSTLSPALGIVSSFTFSHSDWCVGVCHCGVLCSSPVTSNVEYLFICLFAINNLKCLF